MINENIKPTFINFITNLEQQDLVSLVSELVENGTIVSHMQATILRQSGIETIPLFEAITPITDHNLKKIAISYQSNYNGCSVYCNEAVDGTDPDVVNASDELDEISQLVGGAVCEYIYDNGMTDEETCEFRGRTSDVEQICREFAKAYLGDVDVEFDLDSSST